MLLPPLVQNTLYLDSPTTEPKNTTRTTHWDSIRDNSPQIISAPPKRIGPSQMATSTDKPSSVSTTVLVLAAWASACCIICGCCAYCCRGIIPERVWKLRPVRMKKRNSPDEPRRDPACFNNARDRTAHGATQQRALKPEQQDSTKDSPPQLTGEHVAKRKCKFCYEWEKDEHTCYPSAKKLRFRSCDLKARRRQSLQLPRRRSCMDLGINTNLASRGQAVDEFDPIFSSLGCGATSVHVEYASQGPEPNSATTHDQCFSLLDEN